MHFAMFTIFGINLRFVKFLRCLQREASWSRRWWVATWSWRTGTIRTRTAWQRSTTERAGPAKTRSPSCSLKVSHGLPQSEFSCVCYLASQKYAGPYFFSRCIAFWAVLLCLLSGSDVIIKEQLVTVSLMVSFQGHLCPKIRLVYA